MNKISLAFALVFFIALSFTGCKSTKKVGTVEAGGAKAHNEFFTLMQEQAFKYETLTACLIMPPACVCLYYSMLVFCLPVGFTTESCRNPRNFSLFALESC